MISIKNCNIDPHKEDAQSVHFFHTVHIVHVVQVVVALAAFALLGAPSRAAKVTLPPNTVQDVNKNFDAFVKKGRQLQPELDKLMSVHLTVAPRLVLPGEKITIALSAVANMTPNAELEIYPRYLETGGKLKESLKLTWKPDGPRGAMTVYKATLAYTPKIKGNYYLHWKSDIGGDIADFYRYFAVIDDHYAVCCLISTNSEQHGPQPALHEARLPITFWSEPTLFRENMDARQWAGFSRDSRQYGDDPTLLLWCSNNQWMPLNPACTPDESGWQVALNYEKPEVQKLLLTRFKNDVWPLLGYDEPLTDVSSYGIGNISIPMARALGYKTIASLCASQNWQDGTFLINHSGMPDRPFFISKEDFRKTGDGGPDGLVGIQQCLRHPSETSDYSCLYSLEPCVLFHPSIDAVGGSGRRVYDEVSFSHVLDFFEALLQNRPAQTAPYLFNLGLENADSPGALAANTQFVQYAAAKAATQPLVFADNAMVADFMRNHYKKTPESTLYLPDVFAGIRYNDKPACYPDIMQIESDQLKAIAREPEILPYNQYDYTASWRGLPDWGGDGVPRRDNGYTYPDTDDRFRQIPRMIDTRQFKVERDNKEEKGYTQITIRLEAKVAQRNLALAVWNIPRAWRTGKAWYDTSANCRFVPVVAPFSGNLNGFLICQVRPGANSFTLKLTSAPRAIESTALSFGGGAVAGRVFNRDHKPLAYLCSTRETTQTVTLEVPAGRDVRAYIAPLGEELRCLAGRNTFKIGPQRFMRLTGMTQPEIAAQGDPLK